MSEWASDMVLGLGVFNICNGELLDTAEYRIYSNTRELR